MKVHFEKGLADWPPSLDTQRVPVIISTLLDWSLTNPTNTNGTWGLRMLETGSGFLFFSIYSALRPSASAGIVAAGVAMLLVAPTLLAPKGRRQLIDCQKAGSQIQAQNPPNPPYG